MPDFSDEAEEVHRAKQHLRHNLLARRRALTVEVRAGAARRVQDTLLDLLRRLRPALVTGYVPVGAEPGGPDLPDLLATAVRPGGLLLPVLRPDLDLDWASYRSGDPLQPGTRGIREPSGDRLGRSAVGGAAVVVVPALAVDRHGARLGRGGGSYDRALTRVDPATLTIALLHDGELIDVVPARPHDRPVRAVITPATGLTWPAPA